MEYEVIARVTHRLREAAARSKHDFGAYASALNENRKLWQTIAINALDEGNALPSDLRARLVYLAEFTDTHTGEIFRDKSSVLPLLEINVAIMRGLNTEGTPK
jgi:flagellar protein FlaF